MNPSFIPLSVPSFKGNEWTYVKECIDTEWVSSAGKFVEKFEADICAFTGAKHAVACVNGTAALQISLILAGVQAGDEVIVPTATFIAPINVVRYLSAEPVFMDCDDFYNMDVEKVVEFIQEHTVMRDGFTFNKTSGRKISALMPVHVFGNAVYLEPLVQVCNERNIALIEDATESLGTSYTEGSYAGYHTGTVGRLGCVSFNGNKIITTGGGGMILTNNADLAKKARYLTTQAKDDEVRYIHNEVGYNFRLTNLQAALGVAQLEQLPGILERKRANFRAYKERLDQVAGLCLANGPSYAQNNYWMYGLQIDKDAFGRDREQVMADLAREKVQTRPLWYLNHLQKPFLNCHSYKIEKAPMLMERTLNIPCSGSLTAEDRERVIQLLGG